MRKAKFVLIFVLLALLLSAGPGVVMAQEPTPPVPDAALAQEPPVSSPTPTYVQGKEPEGGIEPLGLWMYTNPYRWEYPWSGGRFHVLAVWSGRSGYGQAYTGPGGYSDTCSSSHGCIDSWTWWLRYPESKLGIPFTWYWGRAARRVLGNYWAWNYIW